jgi:glucose-6-phosphate dehydrogenase assembly protein OpcA
MAASAWRAEGTSLTEVIAEADRLRRQAERTGTRAAVMNLVVICPDADLALDTGALVAGLGAYHPGRIIVVAEKPAAPAGLDAFVELHQRVIEDRLLWWEVVGLTARGPLSDHLDSVVEPLLIHDMHVVSWYRCHLPGPDQLLKAADLVVIEGDTGGHPPATTAHMVEELLRVRPVADLTWTATEAWRQALALLWARLDPPATSLAATVAGPDWPAALAAGWLSERLALGPGSVRIEPAERLQARLELGWGQVEAILDDEAARARCGEAAVSVGAAAGVVELLGEILSRGGRDLRYEAAVHSAIRLSG